MGGGGRNSSSKREDPNYATTTKEIHELLCDWLHKVIYSVLCDTLVFVREATNTTISSGAETLDKSCWEYIQENLLQSQYNFRVYQFAKSYEVNAAGRS